MTTPLYYQTNFVSQGIPTTTPPVSGDIGNSLVPIGSILIYGGTSLPSGYLWCDGSSYSTSTYSRLFSVLNYTYGGSGNLFNVPNLSTRIPIGAGTQSNMTINYQGVGVNSGGNLKIASTQLPDHTHDPPSGSTGYVTSKSSGNPQFASSSTGLSFVYNSPTTGGVDGTIGGDYLPPFTVVNYIIKFQ
jgi:microcystin-dependent protein